jgi:hypothetical protein
MLGCPELGTHKQGVGYSGMWKLIYLSLGIYPCLTQAIYIDVSRRFSSENVTLGRCLFIFSHLFPTIPSAGSMGVCDSDWETSPEKATSKIDDFPFSSGNSS